MNNAPTIRWTNRSVRAFAKSSDPIEAIEETARALVLEARERGWTGPPFNPLQIAKMLDAQVEANSSIADARLVETHTGPKIEFNPRQPRERVRFSIAHEVAHLLFPDWNEQVRNRGRHGNVGDEWQLEMLCNIAASEFVLPIGSLGEILNIPSIEDLMYERRKYDVSAEAFMIRLAKSSSEPIGVFFASPVKLNDGEKKYRIDYCVASPTAPYFRVSGIDVPVDSVVYDCLAIGYTDRKIETWVVGSDTEIECVGIPSYPGSIFPRVAALVRFGVSRTDRYPIDIVHGDVLAPRGTDLRVVCQLVNDRARKWGGGVASQMAKRFPHAAKEFSLSLHELPYEERLGQAIFTRVSNDFVVASLIAQEGFGPSSFPRIRYNALKRCLEMVAKWASEEGASVHMPKIGTGAAGGDWGTIEELIHEVMVPSGLAVTIYYPPPTRLQGEFF